MILSYNEKLLIALLFWFIAELFIIKWMWSARPKEKILEKYPKTIVYLSQIAFGIVLKKRIDEDDLPCFITYQKRIRIWFLSLFIPYLLILIMKVYS